MTARHDFAISPHVFARGLRFGPAPSEMRAQGMPGARCARSLACSNKTKHTSVVTTSHTGFTRHSPRNGFNGFLRALPGDRACLPPSPRRNNPARLSASVGAPEPHDFAVRFSAIRQERIRVHRIPPRVRDDRETPLGGTGRQSDTVVSDNPQALFPRIGTRVPAANWHDGQTIAKRPLGTGECLGRQACFPKFGNFVRDRDFVLYLRA